LVDAYTDWCGWCKKMDRDTYTDTKIIETLNKDFIIVKFNPEIADVEYNLDGVKISGRELFAQLTQGKSTGFPTTYFIQPNKKQIQVAAGYLGPEDFLKVLDQIVLILK
jgi:thioredoxin-related protein